MDFVCKLYSNTYAVGLHVTVALIGVATLNLALPAPLLETQKLGRLRQVPGLDQLVEIQLPPAPLKTQNGFSEIFGSRMRFWLTSFL